MFTEDEVRKRVELPDIRPGAISIFRKVKRRSAYAVLDVYVGLRRKGIFSPVNSLTAGFVEVKFQCKCRSDCF